MLNPSKYFDNPKVKEAIRKYTNFAFVDMDGISGDDLGLNMADELPDNIEGCDPTMILKIPARYAFFCRIRDLIGAELREVQRARKNARAMYYHQAANPDVAQPEKPTGLTKVTEKAIEAWVETRPDVMQLNQKMDQTESEYTIMCSACESIRLYMEALREVTRQRNFEERYSELLPSGNPRPLDGDPKEIILQAKNDLRKHKDKHNQKTHISAETDVDL